MKANDKKRELNIYEGKQNGLGYPRRGFLQRCALVTGAFVVGVLRLDKSYADGEDCESGSDPWYCCGFVVTIPNCDLSTCLAKFYWVCDWYDDDDIPYIIRCVECFDVKISSEGKKETNQCRTEVANHREHLRCGVALHPDDSRYLEFD